MIENAKKKRLFYNNSSKGDSIMIYGNKLLKMTNIDHLIECSINEDFQIFIEEYSSPDLQYLSESKIGNFINTAIAAIKTAIKKFRRIISGWFTTAISKISKRGKELKKEFKKKLKEIFKTEYVYTKDDIDIAAKNAKIDTEIQVTYDITQNPHNYDLYDKYDMEKHGTDNYKQGAKDMEKDIRRNPESYGLTNIKNLEDEKHKYDLDRKIELDIFNANYFIESVALFDINYNDLAFVFNFSPTMMAMNRYNYRFKDSGSTYGMEYEGEVDNYGMLFIDDIENHTKEVKDKIETMYPNVIRTYDTMDNYIHKTGYNYFTQNSNGKTYREEYRKLCTDAPDIKNKDQYRQWWRTVEIESLTDLFSDESLFGIGRLDDDRSNFIKDKFERTRKREEQVLDIFNSDLNRYQKVLEKTIGNIANLQYKQMNTENDNIDIKTKQVPKQPFLDYISAAKAFISDIMTTMNSMNNSFLVAVNKCIQADYLQMQNIIRLMDR